MNMSLRARCHRAPAGRCAGSRPLSVARVDRRVQANVASPAKQSQPLWPLDARDETSFGGRPTVKAALGDQFFSAEDSRPVILFDGACNLCNGGVNFMLDWDKEGLYRFAALQSPAGQELLQRSGRRADDLSSIALVTSDKSWVKSQAVLHIAQRLRMPLPAVAALCQLFPAFVRDAVYDQVSENRYKIFGESNECRLMQPGWKDRFLS